MQPKMLGLLFMGTPEHIELGLLGTDGDTKTDEFFEKFQTAIGPPPPLFTENHDIMSSYFP